MLIFIKSIYSVQTVHENFSEGEGEGDVNVNEAHGWRNEQFHWKALKQPSVLGLWNAFNYKHFETLDNLRTVDS